ncbi:MAG: hypothetical protein Fur0032_06830 [Terrimicrobiaceae bacterium]
MAKRALFHPPRIREDELGGTHRPVTWIELFFDLFVVVVLARLAHELGEGHFAPQSLTAFFGAFVPLFWLWVGAAYYIERFETAGLEFRLIMLGFMAAVTGLGAFSHHAMTDHFAGYAGVYAAGRAFTASLWFRAAFHNPPGVARAARTLAAGTVLGAAIMAASILLHGPLRYGVFTIGLTWDIIAPRLHASAQAAFPPVSTSKYPERFGLFTIIALGECAAGLIGGLGNAAHPDWLAGGLCLLLAFGLWWIYFDFVGRRKFRQSAAQILAWVYAHIGLFAAIAIAGAAMREVLMLAPHATEALGVAVAVFLALVAVIETLLARQPGEPAHPVASPAVKLAAGAAAAMAGIFIHSSQVVLALLCVCLLVPMLYGLWVWHTTEIIEDHH